MTAVDKCRCGREGFASISECPRMRCMWQIEHGAELTELKPEDAAKVLNGHEPSNPLLKSLTPANETQPEPVPVKFSTETLNIEFPVQWHDSTGNFESQSLVEHLATMTLPDGKLVKVMRGAGNMLLEFWHQAGYRYRINLEDVLIDSAKRLHAITQGNTPAPPSVLATLEKAKAQLGHLVEGEKCDHDVGICWCAEYDLIDRLNAIINKEQFRAGPPIRDYFP